MTAHPPKAVYCGFDGSITYGGFETLKIARCNVVKPHKIVKYVLPTGRVRSKKKLHVQRPDGSWPEVKGPWYIVGPSRKLIAVHRGGGWSLDAIVGKTQFGIYGTDEELFDTVEEVMEAMKDAEAYISEFEDMGDGMSGAVVKRAIKSKRRYYVEYADGKKGAK